VGCWISLKVSILVISIIWWVIYRDNIEMGNMNRT
jgi:hypothetical protein